MRRVGDRRSAVRLEVVGSLWGTLEVHRRARVRELNRDGALLELPMPVLPGTVHTVTLDHEGHTVSLQVCVRHVRPAAPSDGGVVCHAGVEFLSVPAAFPAPVEDAS